MVTRALLWRTGGRAKLRLGAANFVVLQSGRHSLEQEASWPSSPARD